MMTTATISTPEVMSFVVPTSEEMLRFRAGKLIMLSVKNSNAAAKMLKATGTRPMPPRVKVQPIRFNIIVPDRHQQVNLWFGYLKYQDTMAVTGYIHPGQPFLLLEDPYLVDNKAIKAAVSSVRSWKPAYMGEELAAPVPPTLPSWYSPPLDTGDKHWVLKVLFSEKIGYLFLSMKTWRHDLCIAHPRRVAKYGL